MYLSSLSSESFKGVRLDLYGVFLVKLLLGIRWAEMKYHIKPWDVIEMQGLRQDL